MLSKVAEHKHVYLTPFLLETAYFKKIIRVPTNECFNISAQHKTLCFTSDRSGQ